MVSPSWATCSGRQAGSHGKDAARCPWQARRHAQLVNSLHRQACLSFLTRQACTCRRLCSSLCQDCDGHIPCPAEQPCRWTGARSRPLWAAYSWAGKYAHEASLSRRGRPPQTWSTLAGNAKAAYLHEQAGSDRCSPASCTAARTCQASTCQSSTCQAHRQPAGTPCLPARLTTLCRLAATRLTGS